MKFLSVMKSSSRLPPIPDFLLDSFLLPDFCWFCALSCPPVDLGSGKCLHSWKLPNGTETS